MQVELAKSAGFCFGVQRAVDTVYKQIEENSAEKIYTYGPIIHNEEVIKDMEKKGVEVILSEEENPHEVHVDLSNELWHMKTRLLDAYHFE